MFAAAHVFPSGIRDDLLDETYCAQFIKNYFFAKEKKTLECYDVFSSVFSALSKPIPLKSLTEW